MEIDPATLEAAKLIIQQAEQAKQTKTRQASNERLEQALEMALTRTQGNIQQAADLFMGWCAQDSVVRDELFGPVVREALEARLARIPKADSVA